MGQLLKTRPIPYSTLRAPPRVQPVRRPSKGLAPHHRFAGFLECPDLLFSLLPSPLVRACDPPVSHWSPMLILRSSMRLPCGMRLPDTVLCAAASLVSRIRSMPSLGNREVLTSWRENLDSWPADPSRGTPDRAKSANTWESLRSSLVCANSRRPAFLGRTLRDPGLVRAQKSANELEDPTSLARVARCQETADDGHGENAGSAIHPQAMDLQSPALRSRSGDTESPRAVVVGGTWHVSRHEIVAETRAGSMRKPRVGQTMIGNTRASRVVIAEQMLDDRRDGRQNGTAAHVSALREGRSENAGDGAAPTSAGTLGGASLQNPESLDTSWRDSGSRPYDRTGYRLRSPAHRTSEVIR